MTDQTTPPEGETPEKGYLLSNKLYDFLKNVVLVLLPAVGVLYAALAGLWDLPSSTEVVGTCAAVAVFLGVVVKIGDVTYNNSDARYDGSVAITTNAEGTGGSLNLNPDEIAAAATNKSEVILKVVDPPSS